MNNHWWKSVIKVTMWLRDILRFVVRRCVSHTSHWWGGREQDCNGASSDQLPLGPGRGPQEEAGEENLHSTAHRSGVKSKVGGGVEGVTFVSFDKPHSIQWTTLWLVCIIILYLHLCPQFMWCSHLVYCPEKTMFARIEYRNRKSLMFSVFKLSFISAMHNPYRSFDFETCNSLKLHCSELVHTTAVLHHF